MDAARLARVTDLWVEGDVLPLGAERDGTPICVWVNILNAFERDDVRRAALAAQHAILRQLRDRADPQRSTFEEELRSRPVEDIVRAALMEYSEEDFMLADSDVAASEKLQEDYQFILTMGALLGEQEAPEDDPRREQVEQANDRIIKARQGFFDRRQAEHQEEFEGLDHEDLVELVLRRWSQRLAFQEYLAESNVAEIFYAIRDCKARRDGTGWDHRACDHSQRLIPNRSEVKKQPDSLLTRVKQLYDKLEVTSRDAGNLVAPQSSSVLSERPKQQEESTASTRDETPIERPGT